MNPEKFSNLRVENKEEAHTEALSFSNEVAKETEKVLHERGIDTLSPSDYEKAKEGVEREIIREKLKADPALSEIRDEAVGKIESAAEEVRGILKDAGASEDDINASRRKFLKYFGLGAAAVATGAMLGKSNKAEAGELTQKAEEIERSMLAFEAEIETNTEMIGVLAMLSEDDLGRINSGAVDKELTKIKNNDKIGRYVIGGGISAGLVGGTLGAVYGHKISKRGRSGKPEEPGVAALLTLVGVSAGVASGAVAGRSIGNLVETKWQTETKRDKTIPNRLLEATKYFQERHLQSRQMEIPPITMKEVKYEISRLNDTNKELRHKILKIQKTFRDL